MLFLTGLLFPSHAYLTQKYLRLLSSSIDKYTRFLGLCAGCLVIAMIILIVMIILSRYVFGLSSTKLSESITYLHAILFLFAAPMTLANNGHVRIDLFYAQCSEKYKAWVNLIGSYVFLIPLCLMIFITSAPYVRNSWAILEKSFESNGLPFVFLLKTLIPVFATILLIQAIALICTSLLTLLSLEEKYSTSKKR